jgi:hypothetical protein
LRSPKLSEIKETLVSGRRRRMFQPKAVETIETYILCSIICFGKMWRL